MTLEDFSIYQATQPLVARKLNPMLIPVNRFGFNDRDIKAFNNVWSYCKERLDSGEFKEFELTKAGNIRTAIGCIRGPRVKLTVRKTFIEIILRNTDARYYRFQIGYRKDKAQSLCGHQAFWKYKEALERFDINLEDLAIENGKEVKDTIPSAKIEFFGVPERTYTQVHHIDLNSAFNAGMMEAFPVLEPGIRYMYERRKLDPSFKDVLNMTQGFMQSQMVGFKYAHISKAGYVYTNRRVEELSENLKAQGFRVLAFNTDGIWYQGDRLYTDKDEGPDIGQWKHDWVDCKIRFKSKGCYEIQGHKLKDGIKSDLTYKPVFRGESSYEAIKPRELWTWGDIFLGEVKEYEWNYEEGVRIC